MSWPTSTKQQPTTKSVAIDFAKAIPCGFLRDDGESKDSSMECSDMHVKRRIFQGGKTNFSDNQIRRLKLDHYGMISATCADDAFATCNAILSLTDKYPSITDACAGCGCNAIQFACCGKFGALTVVEKNKTRFEQYTKPNLAEATAIHHAGTRATLICGDYLDYMKILIQDVVFIDAPWGGSLYDSEGPCVLQLDHVNLGLIVHTLYTQRSQNKTKLVVLKAPWNVDLKKMQEKLPPDLAVQHLKQFHKWSLYYIKFAVP